jgi:hypothetical protein
VVTLSAIQWQGDADMRKRSLLLASILLTTWSLPVFAADNPITPPIKIAVKILLVPFKLVAKAFDLGQSPKK